MGLKILFICGSFEPGRDGVGDYVRRLSRMLIQQGHQVAVAAINDRHITAVQDQTRQIDGHIPVLRLPLSIKQEEGLLQLKNWIDRFNPDWLSLQFVPFSYHPKGLIFGLAKKLKFIGKGRKWHIMFHELWVGMAIESSTKEQFWGMAQRLQIKHLLHVLHPAVVHTNTVLYKKYLEKFGIRPVLLPLFSNIPVLHPEKVQEKIALGPDKKKTIEMVVFGGIHNGAPIRQLAKETKQYEEVNGVKITLSIIGRSGKEQAHWAEEWEAAGLSIEQLGEQTEEKISERLAQASFGIFTTPIALVEKSGAVAAMREHGVHLISVYRHWNPKGVILERNPYHILPYKKGNLDHFFKMKPDFSYMPALPEVSEQFINLLMIK